MEFEYCKVEIFIPQTHLKLLQNALREADAGHIGNYDSCLSYSEVTGTWRSLVGSHPYEGEINEVCYQKEYKVEVICRNDKLDTTVAKIKQIHPYEVPVINVIPLYKTSYDFK